MTASFLSNIDLFAPSVKFTFKEKRRHGTALGGCCTLTTLLVISYYTVSSLVRIAQNPHYSVNYTKKYQYVSPEGPTFESISNTTFPAVSLSFRLPPENRTENPWDYI